MFGFFAPGLKSRTVVDMRGYALIVKRENQLIVHQHVGPTRLVFQRFDVCDQILVVSVERRARVELAAHQCLPNKYHTRLRHIHRPVMHAFLGVQQQAMQRAALVGRDLRGLFLPMRIEIMAFDQMRADFFQPLRLDARETAREQLMRLDQLARHHPFSAFFRQYRIRGDDELDAARAQILIAFHALHADVAEQAAEQSFVYLLIAGGLLVFLHTHLGNLRVQLLVQLAPLAQAQRRQEILAAFFRHQAIGLFVRQRLFVPRPDFYVGQKIRTLVGEPFVRGIRRFLPLQRTVTRVLHRQRAGDDEDLGQAVVLPTREQQTGYLGVERQLGELVPQPGELSRIVYRAKLAQQLITVRDHARRGRFDEREIRNFSKIQRAHAQDDGGERHAEYLRVGEFVALQKIRLVVQAHAHAAHHATATPRPLVGGGARDFFDVQLLDLLADAVAIHPRQTAVDHIADVGHGQRGLRHIGRQHHAPLIANLEHLVLFRYRQTRIQR